MSHPGPSRSLQRRIDKSKVGRILDEAFHGYEPMVAKIMTIHTPLGQGRIVRLGKGPDEKPVAILPSHIPDGLANLPFRVGGGSAEQIASRGIRTMILSHGTGYAPSCESTKRCREIHGIVAGHSADAELSGLAGQDIALLLAGNSKEELDLDPRLLAARFRSDAGLGPLASAGLFHIPIEGGMMSLILGAPGQDDRAHGYALTQSCAIGGGIIHQAHARLRDFPEYACAGFIIALDNGKALEGALREGRVVFQALAGEGSKGLQQSLHALRIEHVKEKDGLIAGRVECGGRRFFLWSGSPESVFDAGMSSGGYRDEEPGSRRKGNVALKLMSLADYSGRVEVELPEGRRVWLLPLRQGR